MMFLTRKRNKRSNVNLSHVSPTTLGPGNLVPISFVRILGNDSVSFKPKAFVQAMPMNAPLVNGFKLCLEYFFIPDRLYNANLALDFMGVTDDPDSVKYQYLDAPVLPNDFDNDIANGELAAMADNIVGPGSLADYCDFPVGLYPIFSATDNQNRFNMTKALGYLDVIYHYYVNQQIGLIPTANWYTYQKTGEQLNVTFPVDELESLLKACKTDVTGDAYQTYATAAASGSGLGSWKWFCSRSSIFQRSLPPYYLESWLDKAGYNASEIFVDLEAEGNSISFRNIAAQSHVQRWMDLAMSGGSRYSDYINAQFDCSHLKHTSVPLYLGSDRQMLGSNVIYQTTGAGDSASPLGAFAGQCAGGQTFKKRTYKFGEPGYFMVMASLVPDVIYTRGLDPHLRQLTLGDTYAPALDNISMQPLMKEELDALPAASVVGFDGSAISATLYPVDPTTAVGFVPAWSELMQKVSRSHGRLITDLRYWVLGRVYGDRAAGPSTFSSITNFLATNLENGKLSESQVRSLLAFVEFTTKPGNYTPYIRTSDYNDVFADTSPLAENFVLTFAADMYATRDKAKVNTPTTI